MRTMEIASKGTLMEYSPLNYKKHNSSNGLRTQINDRLLQHICVRKNILLLCEKIIISKS